MLTAPSISIPDPFVLSSMTPQLEVSVGGGASAVYPGPNVALFFPVLLAGGHTYNSAFWLNGATVAGNVDVGIYTISGATATRVVASTAEAQAGISDIQIPTAFAATSIGPGLYYLAISCTVNTATFWRASIGGSVLRRAGCFRATASSPLPATATVASASDSYVPIFGFSESATI